MKAVLKSSVPVRIVDTYMDNYRLPESVAVEFEFPAGVTPEFSKVYEVQGVRYVVNRTDLQTTTGEVVAVVSRQDLCADVDECHAKPNICCPYCQNVVRDSWEFRADSDDAYDCDNCGAVYSWERRVKVTYNSKPVRGPEIVKIN